MEGEHEIAYIQYTDGFKSVFDEVGEEHLYNPQGEEVSIETDESWEDGERVEILDDDVQDLMEVDDEGRAEGIYSQSMRSLETTEKFPKEAPSKDTNYKRKSASWRQKKNQG